MRRRADPALKYRAYTPKISQQEELLAIRHGDFDPKQYDLKLLGAKSRFEEAAEHTRLPQPVSDTELQDMVLPIIHEYTERLFKE